jgi:hypothetical protein
VPGNGFEDVQIQEINVLNSFVRQRNLMIGFGLVIHGKRPAQNICYQSTSMVTSKTHLRGRSGSTHRHVKFYQLNYILYITSKSTCSSLRIWMLSFSITHSMRGEGLISLRLYEENNKLRD